MDNDTAVVFQRRDADTLYNRVDKALYMAKVAGKNQIVRVGLRKMGR